MRRISWPGVAGVLLAVLTGQVSASRGAPEAKACAEMASLAMAGVAITSAQEVPAGPFSPVAGARALTVPAFCRVIAVAAPTADSSIGVEVWIPAGNAWNGKLLGTGNGGFAGAFGYAAMAAGLTRGYAAVGTDTGHAGDQVEFGRGHPEKLVDWASRSIHVMTEVAKAVVRGHRGRAPDRSYFEGCSTGGQQALSEAQRYPRDYDGIIAGDPGHNRVRLILGFLWSWTALHDGDGRAVLPAAKLPMLADAAVAACDASDGLKDGLIADPLSCRFDPGTLRCEGADTASCLTAPQIDAVRKVYDGAKNPRTGAPVFAGWARGSERGWGSYLLNPPEPVRIGVLRYFAFDDPAWDWRTFDWDRDVARVDARLAFLAATSTDLRAFKRNRGKLIMYTGLADPVVPPHDTFSYYDRVVQAMGGIRPTRDFFRFFPVPGMNHCSGGPGPNTFDALTALERWSEQGIAPDSLPASHATGGLVDRTRPLCAVPAVARHDGRGSVDAAASFACVAPDPAPREPRR